MASLWLPSLGLPLSLIGNRLPSLFWEDSAATGPWHCGRESAILWDWHHATL